MDYPIICKVCGTKAKTTLWGGRCCWCGSSNIEFKKGCDVMEQTFEDKLWDVETSWMAKGHQIIIDQEKFDWLVSKVKDLYEVLGCCEDDLQMYKEYLDREKNRSELLNERCKRYETALKAYGDEEGKDILKALDDTEEFIKRFNNGEIS